MQVHSDRGATLQTEVERMAPQSCVTKICSNCAEELPLDQFNWKSKLLQARHSRCKSCLQQQKRQTYQARRSYYIAYNVRLKTERRHRYIQRIREYLWTHPCVDCGETDPVVLDFDHVGDDKTANISYLLGIVASWERLASEINKCEVRCANCHRRKTAREQGWYKNTGL